MTQSSFYTEVLKRKATPHEEGSEIFGEVELKLPIAVHSNLLVGKIIVSYPGFQGNIDGYNNKYMKLANFLQQKVCAVIRSGNNYYQGFDYAKSIQDDLEMIIQYALKNSVTICGHKNPDLYLMGFSAGAAAITAVAYKYPSVKKILLISPSGDAGERDTKKGLAEFMGEAYIVAGAEDDIVGTDAAPRIYSLIKKASVHKMVIIPDCDHQFRGEKNGRIMSVAPLWAFVGKKDFPSTKGSIKLY
jgi:alpha/beta superfamily hydrolase